MQDTLLDRLADVFQISPDTISPETPLGADAWDSLAMLGTMAVLDELFGVVASADELKDCGTVGDVMRLAGRALPADVACDVSGIGIDAERLERFRRLQTTRAGASLVRASYTEAEQAAIGSDTELLTLAWTAKEATAKALGSGLLGTSAGCASCLEIDVTAILARRGPRAGRVTLTGRTAARAADTDVQIVVASGRVLADCAVSMALALRNAAGEDAALQLLTNDATWAATRRRRREDRT